MFRRTFLAVLLATLAFAQPTYFPSAIGDFDGGVGDYFSRGSDLTGNADGKTGIYSFWVKPILGVQMRTFTDADFDGRDLITAVGTYQFILENNSENQLLNIAAGNPSTRLKNGQWCHVLVSWDVGNGVSSLYVNDVDAQTGETIVDGVIDYTQIGWSIGARYDGTDPINGAISELYFAPNQYLDFSVEANRRKFISADLKPVSLGASGKDPTGTPPLIYLPNGDATENKGTGGSFTKVGDPTPTQGPNPPEDIWRPGSRATDFDPTPDYLSRGSDLVGNADGKTGILSAWVRVDGGVDTDYIFTNLSVRFTLYRQVNGTIRVIGRNGSHVTIFDVVTAATVGAGSGWHHFLASWDLANTTGSFYLDDAPQTVTTTTNDTIDYTWPKWEVAADGGGNNHFNGAISELYFAPNQYLDFSVTANRRKFIDANGYPVYLGSDGLLPTGAAPILYLKGAYHNAGTNSGTGGDFVINGTPKYTPGPSTTPWWFDPKPRALSLEGYSGQREARQ